MFGTCERWPLYSSRSQRALRACLCVSELSDHSTAARHHVLPVGFVYYVCVVSVP